MSFRIGSCRINISFYFFAVLCICSLSDSRMMLSGLLAALLHELGHLAAIKLFGLHPDTITMGTSGVVIHVPKLTENRRICIITAFAGPLYNLILFGCTIFFFKGFAAANLALCLLSLLPCEPFDGGVILRALLEKHLSAKHTETVMLTSTLLFLTALVCAGTLLLMKSRYNFSLLTLSMLILTTICQRTLK